MPLSNAEGLAQRKSFLWSYTMLWPAQLQWHKDFAARRTHTLCVMVLAYHFFHSVWLRLFIFFTLPISHFLLHTSYFTLQKCSFSDTTVSKSDTYSSVHFKRFS